MNPLQNRIVPGQTQPAGPQPGVPDLILDAPGGRVPTPQAQPGQTQAPYQAPAQAVVMHVMQDMTAALMEMGMTPTPQNQQMAQLLAGYGHAVNQETMGILRQAVAQLPDRGPANLEAAVILLSKDLPVNSESAAAIKQFLNGQPLPQQLQNLPQEVSAILQQMQQTAQSAQLPAQLQAPSPQLALPGQPAPDAAAAQNALNLAQGSTQTPQASAPLNQTPVSQAAAQTPAPQPAQTLASASQQLTAQQTGQTAIQQPAQQGTQQAIQQVAQQIQGGQIGVQLAAGSAIVQQAAGQAQAIENRTDAVSKLAERTTAEKVSVPDGQQTSLKAIEAVDGQQGQPAQSRQVSQQLPSAYSQQDQQALQQLYLHLKGGEIPKVDAIQPGGSAAGIQTPEEAVFQLLRVIQELAQISGHLAENMQLRDFGQLSIQHQQIMQLTGLLEHKLNEFHQLFVKAFPELAQEVQQLLHREGLDTFSKLAKLLEDNQAQIQERLRLPGQIEEQSQVLMTLRQLVEQVGVSVEKIQAHMVARDMLAQNLPVHVVPMMVHFKGESFPAEIYVHRDLDHSDSQNPSDRELPLKITLTLETKNLGRVGVDLATLKDDMSLDLKVQTRRIKMIVDEDIQQLKHRLEREGDYKLSHLGCQVQPDLESRQSMLLPPKRSIRSLRRIEGIV